MASSEIFVLADNDYAFSLDSGVSFTSKGFTNYFYVPGLSFQQKAARCFARNENCFLIGTIPWNAAFQQANLLFSRDGKVWISKSTNFNSILDLQWTGSQFIMLGMDSSSVLSSATSSDGLTWTYGTAVNSPYPLGLELLHRNVSLAYNGSRYVVATNSFGFITSTDGLSWEPINPGPSALAIPSGGAYLANAVFWDGSNFIAISAANTTHTLAYSADGLTWTGAGNTLYTPTGEWGFFATIAKSGSTLLAGIAAANVSGQNVLVKSTDGGATWTTTSASVWTNTNTSDFNGPAQIKAYNGVFYILALENNVMKLYSTTDGNTLTPITIPTLTYSGDYKYPLLTVGTPLAYSLSGSVKMIAGGEGDYNANYLMDISGSGVAYSDSTGIPTTFEIYASAYNGNTWVIGGYSNNNYIYYSTDGKTWTAASSAFDCFGGQYNGAVYDIIWNGSKFIAVGYNYSGNGPNYGQIAYSTDGITWNTTGLVLDSNDNNDGFLSVGYNGTVYVATCWYGSGLYSSTDGLTWTQTVTSVLDNDGYAYVVDVKSDGSKFVAVGYDSVNSVAYSTNGTTWTGVGIPLQIQNDYGAVIYGNGKWIAVGGDWAGGDCLATSTDGITWTSSNSAPWSNDSAYCVHYDGTKFLIGGDRNTQYQNLWSTTEGSTFTAVSGTEFTQTLYSIASTYNPLGSGTPPVAESAVLNAADITSVIVPGESATITVGAATVAATLFQEGSSAALANGITFSGLPTGGYLLAGVLSTSTSSNYTLLVKAYDASGAPITGSSLNITLTVPISLFASNPPTLNVYSRPTSSDSFVLEGTATLNGSNYEYNLVHTTQYSFQIPSAAPGTAVPQRLVYNQTVHVDLSANEINLADSTNYGHRVVVEVAKASLDGVTEWTRGIGSTYPVGTLSQPGFTDLLLTQLGTSYDDLDGQGDGLDFSSSALDDATDSRLRAIVGQNSVNDWVMAYVLYKLYGASSASTINEVFNIEDVQNMLENVTVTAAIATSLGAHTASVNKLFSDLLISDPKRFFDASGHQITGLFETNPAAEPNSGTWLITAGDVIEIRLEFEFAAAISRRNIADSQLATAGATKEIAAGEKFYVRLQVKAV